MDISYKVTTSKNFKEAVSGLNESLTNHQFTILWQLNFKNKLKQKGIDFSKNLEIFEVCKPSRAKRVLEENIELGCFLPCKLLVFEDDDDVFIGMPKLTQLMGMIENNQSQSTALEIENELKTVMNDAR
ncbi:MAG: DUF302 domain-containing protein [Acetobacterium sp.]